MCLLLGVDISSCSADAYVFLCFWVRVFSFLFDVGLNPQLSPLNPTRLPSTRSSYLKSKCMWILDGVHVCLGCVCAWVHRCLSVRLVCMRVYVKVCCACDCVVTRPNRKQSHQKRIRATSDFFCKLILVLKNCDPCPPPPHTPHCSVAFLKIRMWACVSAPEIQSEMIRK